MAILQRYVHDLRARAYGELRDMESRPERVLEVTGDSGVTYTVEIDVIWDDRRKGHLRVLLAIDDGGLRAFVPMTDSFIVAPDGSFVGE